MAHGPENCEISGTLRPRRRTRLQNCWSPPPKRFECAKRKHTGKPPPQQPDARIPARTHTAPHSRSVPFRWTIGLTGNRDNAQQRIQPCAGFFPAAFSIFLIFVGQERIAAICAISACTHSSHSEHEAMCLFTCASAASESSPAAKSSTNVIVR